MKSLKAMIIENILFTFNTGEFRLNINYDFRVKTFNPSESLFKPMIDMINDPNADSIIKGVLCEEVLGYLNNKQLLEVNERAIAFEMDDD